MTHWFLFPNCLALHHLHIHAKWILARNCQNSFVTIRKAIIQSMSFCFFRINEQIFGGREDSNKKYDIYRQSFLPFFFGFYCGCPFFKEKCSDSWKKITNYLVALIELVCKDLGDSFCIAVWPSLIW